MVNSNLKTDKEPFSKGNDDSGEYSTNYFHDEKIEKEEERRDENSRNEVERLQSIDSDYNPVGVDDILR